MEDEKAEEPAETCTHRKLLSGYCRTAKCPNNIKNHMHRF